MQQTLVTDAPLHYMPLVVSVIAGCKMQSAIDGLIDSDYNTAFFQSYCKNIRGDTDTMQQEVLSVMVTYLLQPMYQALLSVDELHACPDRLQSLYS